MRIARISKDGKAGLAVERQGMMNAVFDAALADVDAHIARGGAALIEAGELALKGEVVDAAEVTFLLPVARPQKIVCLGLNYADHVAEGGRERPDYPVLFPRYNTGLIAHGEAMVRPTLSDTLDYEGEMVAIIGQGGKHIPKERALAHVAGYTICNEGSVREYQRKSAQWTPGKNFDRTCAMGPWIVTPDELPPGGAGLHIETRLNGDVMQSASTSDMIFDVATVIAEISRFMTLLPGDLLVMGTPGGVGVARRPQVFMRPGDVCEVEIERIGVLRNPVVDETF